MPIPDEYTIEEVVRKADNIIVYRANHAIHDIVAVYTSDDALPIEAASRIKRRLYQSGIQMRTISPLNLPFVARTLEVSQNPNEPYIITEYAKYDLGELINNGVRLKPKRIYQIFSQVLQAIVSLAASGWRLDRLDPHQIKLSNIHQSDVSFTPIGNIYSQPDIPQTIPLSTNGKPTDTVTLETKKDSVSTLAPTQTLNATIDKTQTLKDAATTGRSRSTIEPTINLLERSDTVGSEKELRSVQRNIYILGDIAYQLLFGKKYHRTGSTAAVNIWKLGSKWRVVLDKTLSSNLEYRYESYEAMLRDIKRVLSRNKKIAIGLISLIILVAIIGLSFGYPKYLEHKRIEKIKASEAGRAIEDFLNIVNKTGSELPELPKPSSSPPKPDDDTLLHPFDEIPTLTEED